MKENNEIEDINNIVKSIVEKIIVLIEKEMPDLPKEKINQLTASVLTRLISTFIFCFYDDLEDVLNLNEELNQSIIEQLKEISFIKLKERNRH